MKQTLGSRLTNITFTMIMLLVSIMTLYPFLYCLAYSLSDPMTAAVKSITIIPRGFTLKNYNHVIKDKLIYNSFMISVARTVLGTMWSLIVTGLASYAISKRKMPGNRFISIFLIIPMYISGGLMPTYVLYHDLGLFNNFLVFILPHAFWAFNMLLMRTYYDTIPQSLEESAKLDGANDLTIYVRIIIPLSMPIIAVIAMYCGVSQWNSWYDAVLFITKKHLYPLQVVLQQLIQQSFVSVSDLQSGNINQNRMISPESIRMATLVVTTLPIVIVYPFVQKYFIKGVMIGAVKA